MIEIRLSSSTSDNSLITFDGHVIEYFSTLFKGSSRIHVIQIARIEIVTDKHGNNTLSINSKYVNSILMAGATIRPEALAETEALVAAVRQAMAQYP
jgi:hypothetical protein